MKKGEYDKMAALENDHFWFVGKRYFIGAYLKGLFSGKAKKILDIGCGTGGTTKFLDRYGIVTGIEKNPVAVSIAKKRKVRVFSGEAEKLPFRSGFFDLVTIFDVLYHKNVGSVEKVLRQAKRVLKRGGYILITDSAFGMLKGKHSVSVEEQRRFTIPEMQILLKASGFKPVRSSYIFLSILPAVALKRLVLDKLFRKRGSDVFSVNPILNWVLKTALKLESLLVRTVGLPAGSSLIILAKA